MTKRPAGQKELLADVLDAGLCTGCGACVGLCPYQEAWRDRIVTIHPCDLPEGRCHAYCPRTSPDMKAMRERLGEGDWQPDIGVVRAFYVARAADPGVRRISQHGGAVTALLRLAMEEGVVGEVIATTAGKDLLPAGIAVTEPAELLRTGRSRFSASPVVGDFNRRARSSSTRIGVVTLPCQGLALARMRLKPLPDEGTPIDRLGLVIGLFCGWALDWRKLRDLLGRRVDLSRIAGMDIPPSRYHRLEVTTDDGGFSVSLDDVIPCVRPACLACTDMTSEWSDISVGAARLPEGWELAKGWNQVIVRTERGEGLMRMAMEKGILEIREAPSGALDTLRKASAGKKRAAVAALAKRTGTPDDLVYLDPADPMIAPFLPVGEGGSP